LPVLVASYDGLNDAPIQTRPNNGTLWIMTLAWLIALLDFFWWRG